MHYCQIGLNWKKGKFSHILLCKLFTLFLTRMPNAWFSIKSLDSFNQIEDLTIIFLKLEWMRLIKLIVYVVYIFLKNVEKKRNFLSTIATKEKSKRCFWIGEISVEFIADQLFFVKLFFRENKWWKPNKHSPKIYRQFLSLDKWKSFSKNLSHSPTIFFSWNQLISLPLNQTLIKIVGVLHQLPPVHMSIQ